MYKKSFFRGLGTGLVIGALTVTVAFSFDNSTKQSDAGQGNKTSITQQEKTTDSTVDSSSESDSTAEEKTTEKASEKTTEKVTTEKTTTEKTTKDTTEKVNTDNSSSDISSNAGSDGSQTTAADSSKSDSQSSGNKDNSPSDNSAADNSNGSSDNGSAGASDGLSDKTSVVPSSKDNGYTEDKTSQSQTAENTNTEATTTQEATTEAPQPSAIKYDDGGGQITIVDGMSAYEVCQLLEQIGIRNADEYYDWLLRSGYSESLVSGTYTFTGNETNGGIVWILLGNQ